MHLFKMKGGWGALAAWLYSKVVAGGAPGLYRRFVEEAVPRPPAGGTVADVGCGGGQVARLLAERDPACHVVGVDLSASMVRRAARQAGDLPNLAFRQGDAMDLPLGDGSADLVVSVASIKHWPDRLQGLQQIHRVLRPGGALCILEVDSRCSPQAARRFAGLWRFVLPGTRGLAAAYFRRFVAGQGIDLEQLTALLGRAGFVEVEAQRLEQLPFVVARARR